MMATSAANLGLRPLPSLSACAARLARCGHQKGALAPGASIPRIEAYATFAADHQRLAELRELCHEGDGPWAPILWPQMLATPLHQGLVTAPEFPLPALGLVQVRQSILQTVPIPARADLHVRCRVGGHRRLRRGVEIDLLTEVALRAGAPAIWRGVTTALWGRGGAATEVARAPVPAAPGEGERWSVDEALGRRYARCARDFDPQELHALTARWSGLPRPILPATCALARCLAAVGVGARPPPLRVEARFRAPIFLPGEFLIVQALVGERTRFALHPLAPSVAARLHLEGSCGRA